ncbi:MAG TPA: DUF6528 family protein, partial [Pirellulales bacterium]|nr:DUF6528 family protein [Pirellulales bacterium]
REFILSTWLAAVMLGRSSAAAPASDEQHVICAGGSEVFIVDLHAAATGSPEKRWSWSAADDPALSMQQRRWFGNLDECKLLGDGQQVLVCASNSGCGLIERATKKLLWYASATNAHSLELLPRDRVAVASSLSGDRLLVFDLSGGVDAKPVWKAPLHSAHGVVWDDARQTVWAIGYNELREYTLAEWDTDRPELVLRHAHELPSPDGHDLRPVPQTGDLILTTDDHVWLFDRDAKRFRPHPAAAALAKVKAIDVHPATGRVVYSTWGRKVSLLDPATEVPLSSTVYKVRWAASVE